MCPFLLAWSLPKYGLKPPKIMETAVTFCELGLKRQSWCQKIQKVDVYILFESTVKSLSIKQEFIHRKSLLLYIL